MIDIKYISAITSPVEDGPIWPSLLWWYPGMKTTTMAGKVYIARITD